MFKTILLVSFLLATSPMFSQTSVDGAPPNGLSQIVPILSLRDETIFDGISRLNSYTKLGISIEHIVPKTPQQTGPVSPLLRGRVENLTISEALDWLVKLDGNRFVWSIDSGVINLIPSAKKSDQTYALNRQVTTFDMNGIDSAIGLIMTAQKNVPAGTTPIGTVLTGNPLTCEVPLTGTFKGGSLRHALNVAANCIGPGWGWQLTGSEANYFIFFHFKLLPPEQRYQPPGEPHRSNEH